MSRLGKFAKPLLCYVTDRRSLPGPPVSLTDNLLQIIKAAASVGVDWIQIREKDLSGKECAALVQEALHRTAVATRSRTRTLVNDRLDVALAEHAAGVHLGENSIPVSEAKRLLSQPAENRAPSQDFLVGASCHSIDAARSAESSGADYLFFGPVFSTPSKAAFGAPQGIDRLREVCHSVAIPVLAIGGIKLENAASCIAAGAAGIAAIRLFQDASDLDSIVRELREK